MLNAPAARGFRPVATCLSALIPMILIATSSFAQGDYNPKWDAFIGYQYLHPGITVPFGDSNNPLPYKVPDMTPGFGGALTYNFDPHWGAEFDAGYNWSHGNSLGTASVGPRFIWRTDGANFFVHTLLSYNHLGVGGLLNGANGIGAIVGGGMDLPFSKTFFIRLFVADYVFSRHNYADYAAPQFPDLRRATENGVRLRTGLVFSWGGAETVTPTSACSVQPNEVVVGEPLTATVTPSNFNPKHPLIYSWSGNGGQVTGKDTTAGIDHTNTDPGSYAATAHVTDSKGKK